MINFFRSELSLIVLFFIIISFIIIFSYFENANLICSFILILCFTLIYVLKNSFLKKKIIFLTLISGVFLLKINEEYKSLNKNIIRGFFGIKEYKVKLLPVQRGFLDSDDRSFCRIIEIEPNNDAIIGRKVEIENIQYLKLNILDPVHILTQIELKGSSQFVALKNIREYPQFSYKTLHLIKEFEKDFQSFDKSKAFCFGWGMLTGSKYLIDKDIFHVFEKTGLLHLFAVSGLHMGFLYLILSFLLRPLRLPAEVSLLVKITLGSAYLYIIGFPSSGLRAFIMIMCYEVVCVIKCKNKNFVFLCLSGILILFIKPSSLFDLSAQLSFTVVSFILFSIENYYLNKKKSFINTLYNLLIVSLSAASGSALLLLDNFNYFPMLSVFTNVLITPFIFVFYTINLFTFLVFFCFGSIFLFFLCDAFYQIIEYIARFSYFLTNLFGFNEEIHLEIHSFYHLFLFFLLIFSFCFKISIRMRVGFILTYYFCFWIFCFFQLN